MKNSLSILIVCCTAIAMAQNSAFPDGSAGSSPSSSGPSKNVGPRALAGLENVVFENPEETRSFLVPQFRFEQSYDSNAQGTGPGSDERSILEGSLTLQRNSKRRHFDLEYDGGATIYRNNSELNSNFDRLALRQQMSWRRTSLLIDDEVSYFPEAPFGTGDLNLGGGGILAPGLFDLTSNLLPEQSILGQRSSRISNSILTQISYVLSGKRSLTAFGSYGLLRFKNPLFIDSNQSAFGVGYNQQLSPKDTVSTNFDTSLFDFGNSQSIRTHSVNVAYSRVLNGKVSTDVTGGPEFTILDFVGSGASTLISYSVQSSLRYRGRGKELGIAYARGVTGGSGVLRGAETSSVRGYLNRPLGRLWSGEIGVGYSQNSPLSTLTNGSQKYDAIFTDLRLNRVLSRNLDFTVGYQLQNQTSGVANTLTAFGIRHVVSVGFSWRHQPIRIR